MGHQQRDRRIVERAAERANDLLRARRSADRDAGQDGSRPPRAQRAPGEGGRERRERRARGEPGCRGRREHQHRNRGGGHRCRECACGRRTLRQPDDDERGECRLRHRRDAWRPARQPGARAGVGGDEQQVVRAVEAAGLRRVEHERVEQPGRQEVTGADRDAVERSWGAPAGIQERRVHGGGRRQAGADEREREQHGVLRRLGQHPQRQAHRRDQKRRGNGGLAAACRVHRSRHERQAGHELERERRPRPAAGREVGVPRGRDDGQYHDSPGEQPRHAAAIHPAILAPALASRQRDQRRSVHAPRPTGVRPDAQPTRPGGRSLHDQSSPSRRARGRRLRRHRGPATGQVRRGSGDPADRSPDRVAQRADRTCSSSFRSASRRGRTAL